MANKEILPKADYKVVNVGPSREWSFKGDNGEVAMATDSIQFEGHEQFWVDVNRQAKADPPKVGDVLTGDIVQDENAKYPPKFNKERKGGGGFRGGGQASPGAKWASAIETAAHIVNGFYTTSGKKPKSFDEYFKKVEAVAPKVNGLVDKLVASNTSKPAPAANSEAGESPAPAAAAPAQPTATTKDKQADVVIEDIGEDELDDEKW